MRILVLCDRYPDSYQDGLLLRVLHLARCLRERHRMDLVCYADRAEETAVLPGFSRAWTVAPPQRPRRPRWLAPFMGWRVGEFYPRSAALAALLDEQIDPSDYDVIWDAGAAMFPNLTRRWDACPVVADLVDDMVLTTRRALSTTGSFLPRLRQLKYLSLYYRFERYIMQRVAQCCVVSAEDAESFRRVSPTVPVSVVQNGVDLEYFAPAERPMVSERLVFEGSMAFGPNQQAAIFLVREVMPIIWARNAAVTLTLVGRDPSSEIRALAGSRVSVTGSVSDIRPYVHEAEVFVCPLLSGAGIKNKLLQAWAMGKAVVATPLSVGGLDARDGENLLIREGAAQLAQGILELLGNPERRRMLGARGRETVEASYDWEGRARAFERLLKVAAERGHAKTEPKGGRLHAHRY